MSHRQQGPHMFLIRPDQDGAVNVYDATTMDWHCFGINDPILIHVPLRVGEVCVSAKDNPHDRSTQIGLIGCGFLNRKPFFTSIESQPG